MNAEITTEYYRPKKDMLGRNWILFAQKKKYHAHSSGGKTFPPSQGL